MRSTNTLPLKMPERSGGVFLAKPFFCFVFFGHKKNEEEIVMTKENEEEKQKPFTVLTILTVPIIKSTNQQTIKSTIPMDPITFETLPHAVKTILEQVQELNQKIDNLPTPAAVQEQDENRYVDINEIRQTIFPQWKKQTIYNKCCSGELPHSHIGSRLLFNLKECREWRDEQLQKGKIKALSQIHNEAQIFFNTHKNRFHL